MAASERSRLFNNENRFTPGSWAALLLALGFIACAVIYVFLAFQQPSDGWLYETRLDGQLIAVGSLIDEPGPLQPGDALLAIGEIPVNTVRYYPILPPDGWQTGGTVRYTIQRAGERLFLDVPLKTRPLRAIFRFYQLNGTFLLANLLWYLIGFGVFFLRPRETAARLLLLFTTYWNTMDTIVFTDTSPVPYFYPSGLFWINTIQNSLWLFMFAMIIHFVLVFPVPQRPLRRHPRLVLALLYGAPAAGTALALGMNQFIILSLVLGTMILAVVVALITTTVHNLRHLHNPARRAQIGWVVLGISAPVAGALINFSLQSLFPNLDSSNLSWIWNLTSILLPLCIGIAITRYRLFDIDLIIRRTLTYSLLTALLALLYFGGVTVLQGIFTALGGSQSATATVISTLAIAALFNPLRRRLQAFIDLRFYRRKYDTEDMLAQFAAIARQEVEIDKLSAFLLAIVQEAVQPEDSRRWLRKTGPEKPA